MKGRRSRSSVGEATLSIRHDRDHSYFQQLKRQIVSQIYFGLLAAGDRLPATRRLARQAGVNPKTVERIYRRLRDEGYLDIAPRSGAVVRPQARFSPSLATGATQLAFVRKTLREGARLGLSPAKLSELIQKYRSPSRSKELSVVVVECNREQILCFAREIERSLRVAVCPLLLGELTASTPEALAKIGKAQCFATTHYHWDEVAKRARTLGRPTVEIRLNPHFFDAIVERARVAPVGVVVSDPAFVPGFRRALRRVGGESSLNRVLTAQAGNPAAVQRLLEKTSTVFVSPLCADRVARLASRKRVEVVPFAAMMATESLETLEACLLTGPVT